MSPRAISFCVAAVVATVIAIAFGGALARPPETSYARHFESGVYVCAACRTPLFPSDAKFASTTRWPSFRRAIPDAVRTRPDRAYGLERTEALCARCGAHLGHLFEDGALAGDTDASAHWRYCILSASLDFEAR